MKKDILQSIKNIIKNNECIMKYVLSVNHYYPGLLTNKDFDNLLQENKKNQNQSQIKENNEKILNILKNFD
jgi:hypothetical protein